MNFHFEYLRHGKALCGNVFKGFVETFNFHNDFIRNLTGDADLPIGGGHVNVDVKDPYHPVIRCDGFGCSGGGGGANLLPWTFSCTEDPDTGERTGGWTNGRIQVGYETGWRTPDLESSTDFVIMDSDTCDDGYHSIEVDLNEMTVRVICSQDSFNASELEKGIVRFDLGRVYEGKLVYGVHVNPVCYHLL